MGVFRRTPFYLHTATVTGGYVDENGHKHKSEVAFERYIKCDVVPAGAAETRDFGEGVTQSYSFTVWIYDLHCQWFNPGDRVKVEKDGYLSKEYTVKGFHKYQTYCIMWI